MNPSPLLRSSRISSIDILRGVIMLIMALDHTREYFHWSAFRPGLSPTDLATTTPAIFFTRWITHYCAPTFLFLSGLSAYLSGQKKTRKELSSFLIKRGLWLVVCEIVIMTLILTFDPLYHSILLAVIWAIGWSMIILGLLVRGSTKLVFIVGAILFLGHNILDFVKTPQTGEAGFFWNVFLTARGFLVPLSTDRFILFGYAILPWTAIMLLGYSTGTLFTKDFDPLKRKRILVRMGLFLISLFILLRSINIYGDPAPWSEQKNLLYTFFSFINTTKYPVSLLFSCMTLGPALIVLAYTENVSNRFSRFVTVYGRVPFFYFVGHFLLLHILCVIAFFLSGHSMAEASGPGVLFLFRPVLFGWALPVVYLVWLFVILAMYYPCRWFYRYKQENPRWWSSYV